MIPPLTILSQVTLKHSHFNECQIIISFEGITLLGDNSPYFIGADIRIQSAQPLGNLHTECSGRQMTRTQTVGSRRPI